MQLLTADEQGIASRKDAWGPAVHTLGTERRRGPVANLVVHFEIHASEPQKLIDFYSQLLGWRFTQFGDVPYWTIETGEGAIGNVAGTAGHGINGGLNQRRGPRPEPGAPVMGCNFVVGVDDVDSLMRRGVELGGS